MLLSRKTGNQIRCMPSHVIVCTTNLEHSSFAGYFWPHIIDSKQNTTDYIICMHRDNCHESPSLHVPLLLLSFQFLLQVAQANVHSKVMQALGERDVLHEGNVRVTQDQYARQMANLREEQLQDRRRYI